MRKLLASFASTVKKMFNAIDAGLDAGTDPTQWRGFRHHPDKLAESREKILREQKKKTVKK